MIKSGEVFDAAPSKDLRPFFIFCAEVLSVLLIFFIDRVTKHAAVSRLEPGESRVILDPIFSLTLVQNTGAAFGFYRGGTIFFIVFSVLAVVGIMLVLWYPSFGFRYLGFSQITFARRAALVLILGGALGNLVDRIFLGYVIDFLDFRVWPVFNLADSAITVGGISLAAGFLFKKNHHGSS